MKKLLISLLLFFLMFIPTLASSEEVSIEKSKNIEALDVSVKLKKEIKDAIIDVYGKEHSSEIFEKVLLQAQKAINERSKELLEQDLNRDYDWYKNEIIYMFYVDQFGVISDKEKNTFSDNNTYFDNFQYRLHKISLQ